VALIALARERGAERLELLSQTTLEAAVHLYRSLGFVEAPIGPTPYKRSNIRMVLQL
jgi:ribosomal protein S18 acetylase RimI-like enzyme